MHDPGHCPNCGERVSPYAAGCAFCGAELDPKRWQTRPSWRVRLASKLPSRRGAGSRARAR